ncbi:hypothetical protein M422DRAFT_248171 [Sphaerobolus stellatus SS14]|uniref:Uncharacterized protein n=1 Tax=Sphaerobolus stellatus (strain SS14) TaxID=990650 RepID=A0A0C9W4W5_SPHS4|nr:hypothetical protein M422DRAFT_248171 [Sphaerobolus stellatus SS14]
MSIILEHNYVSLFSKDLYCVSKLPGKDITCLLKDRLDNLSKILDGKKPLVKGFWDFEEHTQYELDNVSNSDSLPIISKIEEHIEVVPFCPACRRKFIAWVDGGQEDVYKNLRKFFQPVGFI